MAGGTVGEHGVAIQSECNTAGIQELIDGSMIREVMFHQEPMDDPDIRERTLLVYRCSKNGLLFDHPIWMLWGKMVRGSVQIHDHSRDIRIKKRGHPVMEPVQRPGCGITVENEFGLCKAYQFAHVCRNLYTPVGYRDKERVFSHQGKVIECLKKNVRIPVIFSRSRTLWLFHAK